MKNGKNKSAAGFSLVELMIVMIIISIMAGITGYYLTNERAAYKPDDQALQMIDFFQEARQRSLTQRGTFRVEIDIVDNIIRLIDENEPDNHADDRMIKQLSLAAANEVNIEQRPAEIFDNPPEPLPVASANFRPSIYPPSAPHRVCTLRFTSTGMVLDAGNSPTGTGSVPTGATIHIWQPNKANPAESDIARAITITGTTGSVRLWEYDRGSAASNKWVDSRRSGVFGGGGGATPTP